MKLSEIKGERVFDVIAELIEPITSIAQDKAISEAVRANSSDPAKVATALVPLLLKEHREEVVRILASVNGVDTREYAENLTMASLVKDVYEVLTDKELLAFLG